MEPRINLAREILRDLGRHKFQVILALAILASAMTTIVVTNETRLLTISLNQLLDERDKLDIEWRHLLLEQNALSEHSRVSDIARSKLEMARPSPLKEQIINQP
ncbi:cell division protein FtsL [Pseudaeromonas sharmana]|uniref:Cell division protein FtsL n=1 Tax=Pseudaeromonas sharmana TaxID=328412 RepID=A0ABV8CN48_9GAMM